LRDQSHNILNKIDGACSKHGKRILQQIVTDQRKNEAEYFNKYLL